MGKLGGREIGYGSDLDLLFVYEAPDADDQAAERFARVAQRVLRLVGTPHGEGAGYELDTRLRPSGSHGLLVVPLEGFARYHAEKAEGWERQALVKARVAAGDVELGAKVMAIAQSAAYDRAPPAADKTSTICACEWSASWRRSSSTALPAATTSSSGAAASSTSNSQCSGCRCVMAATPRVRTTETAVALSALEACGCLDASTADVLREGWRFLRRLEQRLRVSHGTSATLLEEGAPGLVTLARRMGLHDGPRAGAGSGSLRALPDGHPRSACLLPAGARGRLRGPRARTAVAYGL